ncbi:hypothetical protein M422DRAFT_256344 [Sphaerobolus stellatus SS14]|uniref:Uncharacterized protein n=1 Tax=Sphaerobolus stellatus (strain SS14) TaxID=990650 RepID=A0A0C9VGU7_SPHS4|nr:hypothetical protein M422DRAFT_256344 [Sphaerobolus stellatus SS14]
MSISKDQYSTSLLPSLPPELAEPIAAGIDSPANLLSQALAYRALYGIIVPFHFHFRKINPKPQHSSVGIVPHEQDGFYPSILEQEGEAYLAKTEMFPQIHHILHDAISRLTGLVNFNYTAPQWIATSQILWTLSTSCPLIQDISDHFTPQRINANSRSSSTRDTLKSRLLPLFAIVDREFRIHQL